MQQRQHAHQPPGAARTAQNVRAARPVPGGGLDVELWADDAPEVLDLPGVRLGTLTLDGHPEAAAGQVRERGARRVALGAPVDLAAPEGEWATVRALTVVRELTALGLVVDWELRTAPDAGPEVWRALSHLYPPYRLSGPTEAAQALDTWLRSFFLCKCVHRQGPGFVQVRDHRAGGMRRYVLSDPAHLAALDTLLPGAPSGDVPARVLADFRAAELVGAVGDLLWWLPYRVRRWPLPSMVV